MNRAEWQQIAEERLLAADALLVVSQNAAAAGHPAVWASAYYLVGYAIECGLKSCVLAHVERTGVIFEDKKYSEKCWTHNPEELVSLAGLKPDLDAAKAATPAFAANWQIVSEWSEVSRYQMKTQPDAEALYNAIVHPVVGVMQWIRARW